MSSHASVTDTLVRFAKYHRDLVARVPAPDAGTWTSAETFADPNATVETLARHGLIESAGWERGRNGRRLWRTDAQAYATLAERGLLDPDRPSLHGTGDVGCPECGREPFVNLRGQQGLRCKACEAVAPKEAWRR